jgi:hypothetical protein
MQILEATCVGGVVISDLGVVPSCQILGEGGSSSGYLVIGDEKFFYLPKISPDTKSLIGQIETLCDKIGALCDSIKAITVLCSAPGAPSGPPINSAIFSIAKVEITAIKTNLTILKNTLK